MSGSDAVAEAVAGALPPLEAFWMPYTNNRAFKARGDLASRMIARAEGVYYTTASGARVIDAMATLWCVNAGHCRPRIVEAIRAQAGELDFASNFSLGNPLAFRAADAVARIAPPGMGHVFFTNSGSEAVDTALKIALGYHRLRGEASRQRFVGRERGYHGVNLAGVSVGGVPANRKAFGNLIAVDHLPHTQDLARSRHSRGRPAAGADCADALERIVALHDASNIAAVIVEPVAGAGGVLVPPRGYLERLRELCTRHGILLVFDEVITGFGRLGAPFASQFLDIRPDLITFAKGVTNAAVPMGGVLVADHVYETFMGGSGPVVELFHGYTYSGHPLASAAALATLATYAEEDLFGNAARLAPAFEDGIHSFAGMPHVVDTRNLGLIGAVELAPRDGAPGARALEVHNRAWERGVFVRPIGDAVAFCPPLSINRDQLDTVFAAVREALAGVA
ncbi:MAG: aminotransferase class III-fold pyridoxal phosphate-dependent enzyme [Burkholderiales bacterium]|nr:aminotransferase class III-fold pyridoxal phosphate-dependent enzyme [Burkholderiales bacterium]